MRREYDIRRIEVIDDRTVERLRALGGEGRLRLMDDLTTACRELMAARVRDQHPEWSPEQIARETARRVRNAST